jgi:hypothetical protein
MDIMSTLVADRHSKGTPASQGGQFKTMVKTEGGIELLVDTAAVAALPVDLEANDGVVSFSPAEVGSTLPAHWIDADEFDIIAGIDTDLADDTVDSIHEAFLQDRYDADVDHPDFDYESVQLRFQSDAPSMPYTRGDAVAAAEDSGLRRYLADRDSGAYDAELADYRTAQAVTPDFLEGKRAVAEYMGQAGWAKGLEDATAGKTEGIMLYTQAAIFAIGEFTNADMPKKQTTQLNRLFNRGFCDRVGAIAETERALELLPKGRGERAGIEAVRDWLTDQA